MDFEHLAYDDVVSVAKLTASQKYRETLEQVAAAVSSHGADMPVGWAGPSEADPTYKLIVTCNELVVAMDNEVATVHNFIKHKCAFFLCSTFCLCVCV